jgi:catechol 2,3-dioxygenase-like lactoylglutathione lyase family enzyme/quercetin dioxygenase-like cupin family protein
VADVILKRFDAPDEVREMQKGRFEIVRVGGLTIGRATYEPGWKWSEHVGPGVGASRCHVEHVGLVVSGAATAAFDDGRVVELRAGELFYIPPVPHDSWVIGDERYVSLHFLGADHYAQPDDGPKHDFQIAGLDHIALAVRDPEVAARWYAEVLGLEREHADVWGSVPAFVSSGGSGLALFRVEGSPKPPPGRDVLGMRHLAFRADRANFLKAQDILRARGLDVEFQDHVVSQSIYFKDPDGHEIEITTYDVG